MPIARIVASGVFMAGLKRQSIHEVFIPSFDAEHRGLLEGVQALRAISVQSGGRQRAFLNSLAEQIEAHFAGEERAMRSSRYPSYDWHKRQHDAARKRVAQFSARVDANETGAISEMASFLAAWLHDHTGLHDRMMAAYLRNYDRARGLAAA